MQYSRSFENYSSSALESPRKLPGKDEKGYIYKKATYQYGNIGDSNTSFSDNSSKNIDQLDALLEDLKNERQITRERDLLAASTNNNIIDNSEPYGTITKTTRVVKTSQHPSDIRSYSPTGYNTSTLNTVKSYNSSLKREGYNHDTFIPSSSLPASTYDSRKQVYENKQLLNDVEIVPAVSTSTNKEIETDLKNIGLSGEILPLPGTKVTTTVRTYTYEIPGDAISTTNTLSRNHNIQYQKYSQNETNNMLLPQSHTPTNLPSTVTYNTESYSTLNKNIERPIVQSNTYEEHEHREANSLRAANTPIQNNHPTVNERVTKNKIVYNINAMENDHSVETGQRYIQNSPISGPVHSSPRTPPSSYGVPPVTNRYFYKETSNTINTINGPGLNNELPFKPSSNEIKMVPVNHPTHSDNSYMPYGTPKTTTHMYKYTSDTTTNTTHDHISPNSTLPPAPFPVDGFDNLKANPPQKVEELMQSFGNADTVDKTDVEVPHRKREVETAIASSTPPPIPSVNRAGKEVYYPPGHDTMLTRREEMYASGAQGGGRWAKGSGMYEYESGSKSKTKTKTGGAMVPVCLPLCCAMPCSIM